MAPNMFGPDDTMKTIVCFAGAFCYINSGLSKLKLIQVWSESITLPFTQSLFLKRARGYLCQVATKLSHLNENILLSMSHHNLWNILSKEALDASQRLSY